MSALAVLKHATDKMGENDANSMLNMAPLVFTLGATEYRFYNQTFVSRSGSVLKGFPLDKLGAVRVGTYQELVTWGKPQKNPTIHAPIGPSTTQPALKQPVNSLMPANSVKNSADAPFEHLQAPGSKSTIIEPIGKSVPAAKSPETGPIGKDPKSPMPVPAATPPTPIPH